MINIAFHLHAYQPPTQLKNVLETIIQESYGPVIKFFEDNPDTFFSLDVARSLGERMPQELLERIKILYQQKRIGLVNTTGYHYILPLVPKHIVRRQINLNEKFYKTNFGEDAVGGIFPPELAFSPELSGYFKEMGYEWFLADDYPFVYSRLNLDELHRAPFNWVPMTYGGCGVLLRSRFWSERIARNQCGPGNVFLEELLSGLKQWQNNLHVGGDGYVILAMDFETFGHHWKDSIKNFLEPFFDSIQSAPTECKVVPLDYIFNHFFKMGVAVPGGSWATEKKDIDEGVLFPLWSHPANRFHQLWNEFMKISFEASLGVPSLPLQRFIDRAFYSCSPWQYSMGNKQVARWCIEERHGEDGLFKKIALNLGAPKKLMEIYQELNSLTK